MIITPLLQRLFSEVAMKMAAKVADYSEDHTSKFPKIVIEKNT